MPDQLDYVEVKAMVKTPEGPQERVIARQKVCPADTPMYNPLWVDEREKYLFAHGWEREPNVNGGLATYRDPKGSRTTGEVTYVKDLPNKSPNGLNDDLNPTKPLQQLVIPAAFHSFTLQEAVEVQARRDQAGESGLTPLEKLELTENRCNAAEREIQGIRATVKGLLTNQTLTVNGIKLALRRLFSWDTITDPDKWLIDPRPVKEGRTPEEIKANNSLYGR